MEGVINICLESGLLLWHKAYKLNYGIPGLPRNPMNLAAFLFAVYKNALNIVIKPEPTVPLLLRKPPPDSELTLRYQMDSSSLYFYPHQATNLLVVVFTSAELSEDTARQVGSALSERGGV
jgi:hypothetical protein